MPKKSITLQDFSRLEFQNQFTLPGNAVLNSPDRLYYVTGIFATGAWKIFVKGNNADANLQNYIRSGNGDIQFFRPICACEVSFFGVTEVSGFWTNSSLSSH